MIMTTSVLRKAGFAGLAAILSGVVMPCEAQVPQTLTNAIQRFEKGASVVGANEIDSDACQPVGDEPTLVRVDLNGDGRDDYAALLKLGETGKRVEWQGRELRQGRFALVLFVDNGKGGYLAKLAHRFTSYEPIATMIKVMPAGTIRDAETGKDVLIENAGVALSFCEKSATAYYLKGHRVRSIPLFD